MSERSRRSENGVEGANREAEILGTDRLMNGDPLFCCESCYAAFPSLRDAFVTNAGALLRVLQGWV